MSADLLSQLTALIATAETNRVDSEQWHHLIVLLGDLGYGPRITPEQIAELVPNIHGLQELCAATQEVIPQPPAGSKMPRRKLTPDDERVILARVSAGVHPEQIADDLGIARKIVVNFVDTHDA